MFTKKQIQLSPYTYIIIEILLVFIFSYYIFKNECESNNPYDCFRNAAPHSVKGMWAIMIGTIVIDSLVEKIENYYEDFYEI